MSKINIPPDTAPAPWSYTQGGVPGWQIKDKNNNLVCFSKDNPYNAPNAEFIIWARNNIDEILYENIKLNEQAQKVKDQTVKIRQIYKIILDIEQWLIDTDQPDTYIQELKELLENAEILRKSTL